MPKWEPNHDGTEYMLLEQSDAGTRQIVADVRLKPDGLWHWSATREDGMFVAEQFARSFGDCVRLVESFLEG